MDYLICFVIVKVFQFAELCSSGFDQFYRKRSSFCGFKRVEQLGDFGTAENWISLQAD
jgi:hypothetical protein